MSITHTASIDGPTLDLTSLKESDINSYEFVCDSGDITVFLPNPNKSHCSSFKKISGDHKVIIIPPRINRISTK